jgi:hypothetical protein
VAAIDRAMNQAMNPVPPFALSLSKGVTADWASTGSARTAVGAMNPAMKLASPFALSLSKGVTVDWASTGSARTAVGA